MNALPVNNVLVSHVVDIAKQISDLNIGSSATTAPLLYLLPPCLVFLAVDIANQYANRRLLIANEERSARDKEEIKRLAEEDLKSFEKLKHLQQQLAKEKNNAIYLRRLLKKQKKFMYHRERLEACGSGDAGPDVPPPSYTANVSSFEKPKAGIGAPFTVFCERLLFQNKIWKQQQEIKKLQSSLESHKNETTSNAFQAFCDRLLLENQIRKQQKEIERLVKEAESLERARAAAVTRAAKHMVQDVSKERLVEEFVKDLISEVNECRKTIVELRAAHEQEIRELAGEYRKDCRRLARDVERLKLSQEARLVEQELSNAVEEEFVDRIASASQPVSLVSEPFPAGPDECVDEIDLDGDTLTDIGLETMSNMSTSTCVGSTIDFSPTRIPSFTSTPKRKMSSPDIRKVRPSPLKLILRTKSSSSLSGSPVTDSPSGKVEPIPYSGFSFNPRFFGADPEKHPDSSISDSKRPRTSSLKVGRTDNQQPKRVQWKF
ncbi:hypothetical protein CPC08DRAFT_707971 [Agrocybe pediades]|nr:hypothetical protein CPC08DRAFT_707971 [Agrocybe pediades]